MKDGEGQSARGLGRDIVVLFTARSLRMFAYGLGSVVLLLYLAGLGFGTASIGVLLTLALLGDTALSFWITTRADRVGRRRMLLLGALLILIAGISLATSNNYLIILIALTIACIVVIEGGRPDRVARSIAIPAAGPHGLDLDPLTGWLYCACDDARIIGIDPRRGAVQGEVHLTGAPDVIFIDSILRHLFVASGTPGTIDVIDIDVLALVDTLETEPGAHTMGFDPRSHKLYALLPRSHRAKVFAA
jgi:hypothetical protein